MKNPILLYSTNTRIAYNIAERFFGQKHYVWCLPNRIGTHAFGAAPVPPSSDPFKIYRALSASILGNDRHCPKISQNKLGIMQGAEEKLNSGDIDRKAYLEIVDILDNSDLGDFSPLLYVIPFSLVEKRIVRPPAGLRASALSPEVKIVDLKSEEFDPLELD